MDLDAGAGLIDAEDLAIGLGEEEHSADPCQPGLLVRDRDLFRQLMLALVLVRRHEVQFGAVRVHEELEIERSIRRQADQGRGRREGRRQARARACMQRAVGGERRRSDVAE